MVTKGKVCKITVVNTGKSALIVIRGTDDGNSPLIRIDSMVRDELGVKRHEKYQFKIEPVSIIGYYKWAFHADDPGYRVPFQIGIVGLFLGILALILSAIPLLHH